MEGYHHQKKVKLVPSPVSAIFTKIGKLLGFISPDDDEADTDNKSSSLALSAVKGALRGGNRNRSRSPSPGPGVHVQTTHTQVTTNVSTRSNNQLESGILDTERVGRRRSSEDLNGPWHSRGFRDPSPTPTGPKERLDDGSNSVKTVPSRFSAELH